MARNLTGPMKLEYLVGTMFKLVKQIQFASIF